jgi:multisubunit Na+/H+ antiporter MnhF subunit
VTALAASLSPGSVLVDIDWDRRDLLMHVIDASDPDGVRAASSACTSATSDGCSPDVRPRLLRRHRVDGRPARRRRRAHRPSADDGERILALDLLTLILIGLLALAAGEDQRAYALDAALALALLSFVATLAASRYYEDRGPFS